MHGSRFFAITVLFLTAAGLLGCESGPAAQPKQKGGRSYGVTSGLFRHKWYHYYERALSYADGGFWQEARQDLTAAIQRRGQDQRRARTYGLIHFIDYFPHRELGIVLYRTGRYPDAVRELEESLASAPSAKAEMYLDLARQKQIEARGGDRTPPRIALNTPANGPPTRAFSMLVNGVASDDTFVGRIRVGDADIRVDGSRPNIPFSRTVPLVPGENRIHVLAADLFGNTAQAVLRVHVDREGPLICIDTPRIDTPCIDTPRPDASAGGSDLLISGNIFDASGIAAVTVQGRAQPVGGARAFQIRTAVRMPTNAGAVVIRATDLAGNTTTARISLPPSGNTPAIGLLAANQSDRAPPLPGTVGKPSQPAIRLPNFLAVRTDHARPVIQLAFPKEHFTTYLDEIYVEGGVQDDTGIKSLSINGQDVPFASGKTLHFNHLLALKKDQENVITVRAVDLSGNAAIQTVRATHREPTVKRPESRMTVAVAPFKRDAVGTDMRLSHNFENHFKSSLRNRRRFLQKNLRVGNAATTDESEILELGRQAGFDGVLFGGVLEREANRSVEIGVRLVDTETGDDLVFVDVYGENVDRPKLKLLSEGLEMKLADEWPVLEGAVTGVKGRELEVTVGEALNAKAGMKLIVFEQDPPTPQSVLEQDFRELGRARITFVEPEKSVADLLDPSPAGAIHENHHVISR